jgi:putative photosynthetic complex assembly protein 2
VQAYGLPILYTLLVWWVSTGVILWLVGLPRHTHVRTLLGATVLLVAALLGLAAGRGNATVGGAYIAFTCTVLVWAWVEVTFLTGFATGPREAACRSGCDGWRHVGHAIESILYHELVLIAAGASVVAVTWDGANQVGAWTFLVLWAMRQSAKLNLFLGVRNPGEAFLPDHLRYLGGFFTRRPMNLLFPVSVTASTAVAVLLWREALVPGVGAFDAAGLALVGSLLALAILEHWFMVVPLPTAALWSWGLSSRRSDREASGPAHGASAPEAQRGAGA